MLLTASNRSTGPSSTNHASARKLMIRAASLSTITAALNHASGPWKNARKATCGRYVKMNRNARTAMESKRSWGMRLMTGG